MKPTPFEKRIKRRVTARKQTFFASTSPGLKQMLAAEFQALPLETEHFTIAEGGVVFSGSMKSCYLANLYLGTASRITMEIGQFKAENFRTLEKKLAQIEWELYLKKNSHIHVEAVTRHSRLYHTTAIEERALQIIQDHLNQDYLNQDHLNQNHLDQGNIDTEVSNRAQTPGSYRILIRVRDDQFNISLDTSGDLLHKRGITRSVGMAPLRSTLARSVLTRCGFTGKEPLIDPMCGSGSFALEGAIMASRVPPGFYRSFAFEDFPCFSKPQWNHLKKTAQTNFLKIDSPLIFAFDRAGKLINDLEQSVADHGFSKFVKVGERDFFDVLPEDLTDITNRTGVVVLNPPYGKRLGEKGETAKLYRRIGEKLARDFKGWTAGIILPEENLAGELPFHVELHPLFHGGLEIHVATGKIG
jgi:putative N6-adenine-specific DNA methylase